MKGKKSAGPDQSGNPSEKFAEERVRKLIADLQLLFADQHFPCQMENGNSYTSPQTWKRSYCSK